MLTSLTRNWWLIALRGTLAVIFGAVAFVWPGITFEVLVLLFGAYALVDGALLLTYGLLATGSQDSWWPLVLAGILGIAIGVLTFAQPATTALALVYLIGAWAIITGLLQVVAAIRLRDYISNEWLMGISGVLSILFGALVVAQPGPGSLALVYLFGFYAILMGAAQIAFGFRLRSLGEALQPRTQQVTSSSPSR
jgi:uncharacterized membrane protein HdeD (DUF308 family)